MTDLELDVWDAWLRERQEHLEETLSNISPSDLGIDFLPFQR